MKLLIDGDVLLYLAIATNESETLLGAETRYYEIYEDIMEHCFIDDPREVYLFLSGSTNFRKVHWPVYKSNRKAKPELMPELKSWVASMIPQVIICEGYEADDGLLIMASDLNDVNEEWVIATVDKDLMTMPGRFFNVRTNEHKRVSPGEAYTFMIQQFVHGDRVDGIDGIRGWGPKKTGRLIHDGNTIWENFETAKEIWAVNYGQENYKEKFEETANLAYIRRSEADLKPLDFWGMSEREFRESLRLCI